MFKTKLFFYLFFIITFLFIYSLYLFIHFIFSFTLSFLPFFLLSWFLLSFTQIFTGLFYIYIKLFLLLYRLITRGFIYLAYFGMVFIFYMCLEGLTERNILFYFTFIWELHLFGKLEILGVKKRKTILSFSSFSLN